MPRRLLVLNALLGLVSLGLAGYIVVQLTAPIPAPPPPAARRDTSATPPGAVVRQTPPGGYTVIASRSLFSPTRSDAPSGAAGPAAAARVPKPNLYGVVLRDGSPLAYLEDPLTKRVAAYRVGDVVAGGTLRTIAADHVVLVRPEGPVDVRLHDPSRPRPPVSPGPGQAPVGLPPGMTPPAAPPVGAAVPRPGIGAPQLPGPPQFPVLPIPSRQPQTPNLLRRVPPGLPSDATGR